MTQFTPSKFQLIPPVVKNLLIINVLVLIAQNTVGNTYFNMNDTFALHTWQSSLFKPWQVVTHVFMHGGINHIFSNMLALYFFGSVLENLWGSKRFLLFYLVCGLGAALFHLIALYVENQAMVTQFNNANDFISIKHFIQNHLNGLSYTGELNYDKQTAFDVMQLQLSGTTVGASGAVFGCLAAFAYLFPNTEIYLYFFIPLKAKWFVLLYAAFELTMSIRNSAGDNVAHIAHLGGAVVGFALVYFWNKTNRKHFY
jgi:membrane associated rhomboid family serine protease